MKMKTKDYWLFNFMENNRPINNGLVKKLMQSINEIGYLESKPILVNENMLVIDGQHRLEACKRLNIMAVYEIANVNADRAMLLLNANQRVWRNQEYIHSFALSGQECYQTVILFDEKYKLGISNSLACCFVVHPRGPEIRAGKNFLINPHRHEVANFILNCKDYLPFYKTLNFVRAVKMMYDRTTPENCNKVLDKIQSLRQQVTHTDYLVFFENILNRYKRGDDMIRLRS